MSLKEKFDMGANLLLGDPIPLEISGRPRVCNEGLLRIGGVESAFLSPHLPAGSGGSV